MSSNDQQGQLIKSSPISSHWTRHIASLNKSDFIYKSSYQPLIERFEVLRKALLFSVIIPSQEINCENIAQYSEEIHVNLIKFSEGDESIEAYGNFTEYSPYNDEIAISLASPADTTAVLYPTLGNNYYIIEIKFGREGYYPWFHDRKFSSSFIFAPSTDKPGLIMGFEYNLVSE